MPRKLRELMAELEGLGFVNRGRKGGHRKYLHRNGARLTLAGQPGDDAKSYQERDLAKAVRQAKEAT
jgi:predicted RNA binding protein YcfA (HicA-like mRNA interferase family)